MKNKMLAKPSVLSESFDVHERENGIRIDSFLNQKLPEYSRTFLKTLLRNNHVVCNKIIVNKPSTTVHTGDHITITIPEKIQKDDATISKDLEQFPVVCLAQAPSFLVIDKPAGLLVHNTDTDPLSTTLVDWIRIHYPSIATVGEPNRPGIVHRLDRNTSGIMLIAKNKDAYTKLINLFKQRKIKKTYIALVKGHPDRQGTISFPVGRHPHQRHKISAYKQLSLPGLATTRPAETDYTVIEYFPNTSYLKVITKTGRTHQIRVHLSAIGHPLIGDHIYGSSSSHIPRHALHAQELEFELDGNHYHFSSPIPQDFLSAITALK